MLHLVSYVGTLINLKHNNF